MTSAGDPKRAGGRPFLFLAVAAAAGAALGYGMVRGEFGEVLRSAVVLCLSCIGIG